MLTIGLASTMYRRNSICCCSPNQTRFARKETPKYYESCFSSASICKNPDDYGNNIVAIKMSTKGMCKEYAGSIMSYRSSMVKKVSIQLQIFLFKVLHSILRTVILCLSNPLGRTRKFLVLHLLKWKLRLCRSWETEMEAALLRLQPLPMISLPTCPSTRVQSLRLHSPNWPSNILNHSQSWLILHTWDKIAPTSRCMIRGK